MHMSPSGFPGLVIVILTIFMVATLFVSYETTVVLFWVMLLAVGFAGAVSLRGWLRQGQNRVPPILLRLIYHWPIVVGAVTIPQSLSYVGFPVSAGYATWAAT